MSDIDATKGLWGPKRLERIKELKELYEKELANEQEVQGQHLQGVGAAHHPAEENSSHDVTRG